MEKINIKQVRCQAKIFGTLLTVAGAMLMTLYKGPIMELFWVKHRHPQNETHETTTTGSSEKDWILGCTFLILATFAWACLFVLQVRYYTLRHLFFLPQEFLASPIFIHLLFK
jgi:hypothetical protein